MSRLLCTTATAFSSRTTYLLYGLSSHGCAGVRCMYCMYFCICMHDARTFRLNGAIDHVLWEVRRCGISSILPPGRKFERSGIGNKAKLAPWL